MQWNFSVACVHIVTTSECRRSASLKRVSIKVRVSLFVVKSSEFKNPRLFVRCTLLFEISATLEQLKNGMAKDWLM